jgi:hypothetical protein
MRKTTKLRGLALFGLLGLCYSFPTLITPRCAMAYGLIETETFYSDDTYSTIVGRCVDNSCRGTYICSGTMTEFSKVTTRLC